MTHPNVTLIEHALVSHKLTLLRSRNTLLHEFRRLMRELGLLIGMETMRDLALMPATVETPIGEGDGQVLVNPSLVIIPVLRAGLIMAEAFHDLVPTARGGHIGLLRRHGAEEPATYLVSVPHAPETLAITDFLVVDPIIATGRTMRRALEILREEGIPGKRVRVAAVVATPQGLDHIFDDSDNADVRVFVGAIDPRLDGNNFVSPGLGDVGDRQFGTISV